jgi:hypothetical protein
VQAGMEALAQKLAASKGAKIEEMRKEVTVFMASLMNPLEDFKSGLSSELEFDAAVLKIIKDQTGVDLTTREWNEIWSHTNPSYDQFSKVLNDAIEFNKQPNQKVVFVSYTNPKDMRHLRSELAKNNVPFEVKDNHISAIDGITIHTTYYHKQTKEQLIENVIKENNPKNTNLLFASIPDIQYVKSVKSFSPFVDKLKVIEWDKKSSLSDVLNDRVKMGPALN